MNVITHLAECGREACERGAKGVEGRAHLCLCHVRQHGRQDRWGWVLLLHDPMWRSPAPDCFLPQACRA